MTDPATRLARALRSLDGPVGRRRLRGGVRQQPHQPGPADGGPHRPRPAAALHRRHDHGDVGGGDARGARAHRPGRAGRPLRPQARARPVARLRPGDSPDRERDRPRGRLAPALRRRVRRRRLHGQRRRDAGGSDRRLLRGRPRHRRGRGAPRGGGDPRQRGRPGGRDGGGGRGRLGRGRRRRRGGALRRGPRPGAAQRDARRHRAGGHARRRGGRPQRGDRGRQRAPVALAGHGAARALVRTASPGRLRGRAVGRGGRLRRL